MSGNKKIVIFSGAGMSAESGIQTFRDSGGLWEKYRIEEVATPEAWKKNKELVLDFYNQRRKQIIQAQPNEAHQIVSDLQRDYDVVVITQNIDDLHERAGSRQVLHLHGEIMKARSTANETLVYPIKGHEIKMGDICEVGSQLRPHIVWFGEMVPEMERAMMLLEDADVFVTIGTSLNVYPAANLMHASPENIPKYLIDPGDFNLSHIKQLTHIKSGAIEGMRQLRELLKQH